MTTIKKDIAIYGAGGYGREVACLLKLINEKEPQWQFIGFFDDDPSLRGSQNVYGPILGGMEELNQWDSDLSLVIAIGSPDGIRSIVQRMTNERIDYPNIVAPSVVFLDRDSVKMGRGNIVGTNCFVSCNVEMGDFNIFNGYVPIGHDVKIGSCNVFMPSSHISGGVVIGDNNFMGLQAVVLQYLKIGNHTRIGANSVIMRKTKDGFLYIGNPAKRVEF